MEFYLKLLEGIFAISAMVALAYFFKRKQYYHQAKYKAHIKRVNHAYSTKKYIKDKGL